MTHEQTTQALKAAFKAIRETMEGIARPRTYLYHGAIITAQNGIYKVGRNAIFYDELNARLFAKKISEDARKAQQDAKHLIFDRAKRTRPEYDERANVL